MPADETLAIEVIDIKEKSSKFDRRHEWLPYEVGYLTEEMKLVAQRELNETEERKELSLTKFRKLIAEERNFYMRTDDIFLLAYLRSRKFEVERAFKTMQNAYRLRKKKAHFFDSEDNTIVHDVFRQNFIGFLPYRAKDGSVILTVKVGIWDPDTCDRDLLMWTITHCLIHSIEDPATQVMGYTGLIDVRGVSTKHLKMLTLENILLIIYSTQSCFPGRYKSIHVVGMPKIFNYAWNIVYPFIMNLKLKKRIFIHGEDVRSLHKHLPPAILPEEFGGELGPFDNSEWHASILAKNEWCLEQRLYGYQT